MNATLIQRLSQEKNVSFPHAQSALRLLVDEGCSIPFVARYRKEVTGSMNEVVLREIRDQYQYEVELEETKNRYLKTVAAYCKEHPEAGHDYEKLEKVFQACTTKQALEDLYLPFRPKKRTKASLAREKGLGPIWELCLKEKVSKDFSSWLEEALKEQGLTLSLKEATQGMEDLAAEFFGEDPHLRSHVRNITFRKGILKVYPKDSASGTAEVSTKKPVSKETFHKYETYLHYAEPVEAALPHRIMAVRRGETEGVFSLAIEVPKEEIFHWLETEVSKIYPHSLVSSQIPRWVQLAYERFMATTLETEVRLALKKRAEDEAIQVFAKNLGGRLMQAPLPKTVVMGIDPGLRTGSKIVVISQTGKLLAHRTVFTKDQRSYDAFKVIRQLLETYHVQYIAIGNGTGSKEIEYVVREVQASHESLKRIHRIIVDESGASVYSTDDIAREEFPDLDPTLRSAVSIARRLQDPLAELVKIDPRSLGLGQYQHDCHVGRLNQALKDTVESCVNRVGVDLNTASYKLLSYVAGLNSAVAKRIVAFRDEKGPFHSRKQLTEVQGLGPKMFEQAAGFLRICEGADHPLDASGVHPERYSLVEQIAQNLQCSIAELLGKKEILETLPLENYVTENAGLPTLLDIVHELSKPGRDPREEGGSRLERTEGIHDWEDLKVGMTLTGTVTNVANFGAFVDLGVHNDGLVHISELSDRFVRHPHEVVKVGDVLQVKILELDKVRQRIVLTCRSSGTRPSDEKHHPAPTSLASKPKKASKKVEAQTGGYSLDDLLQKFQKS